MRPHSPPRIPLAVAMLSLFAMLTFFPLIRSGLPLFGTPSTARVLMGLFEIIFVIGISFSGKFQIPIFSIRPWISCVAMLWLLWSFLALVFAEHPAAALVRQSEWYIHLLFGVTLWSCITADKKLAGNIIKAILGGFLLYCLFILYLWHIIYPSEHLHKWLIAMPGFNNIRHFGCYAMIAVILAAFPIFANQGRKWTRFIYFIIMAFCWGALIWSGSRGAILAIIFSMIILLFFIPAPVKKRLLFYQVPAFSAGAFLSSFYRVNLPCFGMEHFSASLKESTISGFSSGRTDIWMETIPAVLNSPFLGVGPDGFLFIPRTYDLSIAHPHNLFLQAALDWGLPGLIFTSLLIFAVLQNFCAQLRQRDGISGEKIVSIWGFTALCLLAMIDGPFYFAHSLALSSCLLAIALHHSPAMQQPAVRVAPFQSLIAFMRTPLLAVLVAHLWIVSSQLKEPPPEPDSLMVKLVHALPTDISFSTRWAEKWAESSPEEAIEWLHWGHEQVRFGLKPTFLYAEAQIHMQQKRWQEARMHLEEAHLLCPLPKGKELIRRDLDIIDQALSSAR